MSGPLSGYVVLDWTHALAGPFCGCILADLGADVIKIETADLAASSRGDNPSLTGPNGEKESASFMMVNRNKRSFAVDMKSEAGRQAFHRLVASADVLIQNFRPGTTRKLGCDYDTLAAINPGLVYCSISGFGLTSPYGERAGVDLITQGMSGLMSITGEAGGEPVKAGVPVCDVGTGMYGVIGILASLMERQRTGRGQHVDVCLMDTPISWMVWEAAQYFADGEVPGRLGSGHRLGVPYRAYRGADGKWLTIGASSNKHFALVCAILGAPELATDPRFDTGAKRRTRRAEVTATLQALFDREPAQHWIDLIIAAGVPCGPINTVDHVLDREPHVKARKLVVDLDHPAVGPTRALATPIKLSASPVEIRRPAPRHGEHTVELLRSIGVAEAEISRLIETGAIGTLAGAAVPEPIAVAT